MPVWAHPGAARLETANGRGRRSRRLRRPSRTSNDNARVYFGDPGRGKSFLACAIALGASPPGMSVRWITWPDLLSSLKDQMRDDKPLRAILEPINRVELLVVDEVKGIATPFSSEVAELLIGRRAELGRKVVITANLDEDNSGLPRRPRPVAAGRRQARHWKSPAKTAGLRGSMNEITMKAIGPVYAGQIVTLGVNAEHIPARDTR